MNRPRNIALVAPFITALAFAAPAHATIIFFDDFDAATGGNYILNADADSQISFNYNYADDGIPAAPNSVGTTRGVKFEANMFSPTGTQALNISPIGGNFTGDFILRFDMWINVNGPFPDGGAGSTEFITAGVGTAGFTVQKSSGFSDGTWFAVDGEGGSGIDFRAYLGTALEGPSSTVYAAPIDGAIGSRSADNPYYHTAFPGGQEAPLLQQQNYPAQTGSLKAGTMGFAWRDVAISKIGDEVTWSIDGLTIATVPNAPSAGNNIFVGYWDVFASVSDNAATSFGIVDNLRVEAVPEPSAAVALAVGGLALFAKRRRPAAERNN